MTELKNMQQRLRQLQRHSNDLHGAVQAVFREYRANISERRSLETERFEFKQTDKRHSEIVGELAQLEAEFARLDAIYHDALEKWNDAGTLVSRCEEYLEELSARRTHVHTEPVTTADLEENKDEL